MNLQREERGIALKKIIFQEFLCIPCREDSGIALSSREKDKVVRAGEART